MIEVQPAFKGRCPKAYVTYAGRKRIWTTEMRMVKVRRSRQFVQKIVGCRKVKQADHALNADHVHIDYKRKWCWPAEALTQAIIPGWNAS